MALQQMSKEEFEDFWHAKYPGALGEARECHCGEHYCYGWRMKVLKYPPMPPLYTGGPSISLGHEIALVQSGDEFTITLKVEM
jgi:hypothetical protein